MPAMKSGSATLRASRRSRMHIMCCRTSRGAQNTTLCDALTRQHPLATTQRQAQISSAASSPAARRTGSNRRQTASLAGCLRSCLGRRFIGSLLCGSGSDQRPGLGWVSSWATSPARSEARSLAIVLGLSETRRENRWQRSSSTSPRRKGQRSSRPSPRRYWARWETGCNSVRRRSGSPSVSRLPFLRARYTTVRKPRHVLRHPVTYDTDTRHCLDPSACQSVTHVDRPSLYSSCLCGNHTLILIDACFDSDSVRAD